MSEEGKTPGESQGDGPVPLRPDAACRQPKGCPWCRLILVAVVAAVLGAMVTANWHDVPFSVMVAVRNVKAGLVILAAAALGFVLGVVFLWSAIDRQEKT